MRSQAARSQLPVRAAPPRDDRRSSRPATGRTDRARVVRRERERHLRRLRRDLLVDLLIGVVATLLVLAITAGLGVIAIIEVPLGAAVIASFMIERRRRTRRRAAARRVGRLLETKR